MSHELPLKGGQVTPGVVRIGHTVRRPLKPASPFVHQLLQFLEKHQFVEAPRFLGIDANRREILDFIDGTVLPGTGYKLTDQQLIAVTQLIRRFHDLTEQSALKGKLEIVVHGDLGTHNTVFQDDQPVGLIDWDDAKPGTRLQDFANAVGNYVDLGNRKWPVVEQARRVQLMSQAYEWKDPVELIDFYEADLHQALLNHQRAGRQQAVAIFKREVKWFTRQAVALRNQLVAV